MAFHYVITCFKCIIIRSQTEYSFLSKQSAMSVCKTARFMFINRISKMVWDNESYEAEALRNNSYEDKGGFENKPEVSHLQPD